MAGVADACDRAGLPLLAMLYPRGPGIKDHPQLETLLHAAALAVDLGADIVKLPLQGPVAAMKRVVDSCPIPVLAAGGAQVSDHQFGAFVADVMVWRKVKPFARVEKPVIRYLSAAEARRLVNACPPDFRRLVQAALLTGCRYSELTNLSCVDFNTDSDTLTIRQAKAGKPRHVVLTSEGRTLFTAWTAGRPANTHIFVREDGHPWGKSHQQRPLIEASEIAKIAPPVNFHVLRHTHASHLAMKGVGLGVIAAQLGHADTRMTERHYAHLAPSYVADTIRAHFPKLGIAGESTVVAMKK